MNRFSLSDTRAFVTGANTGIGQAIAVDLAASAVKADLGTVAAAQSAFVKAEQDFGPIDTLVNNAGIIRRDDSLEFTEADWDAVMDINLKVVFFLSQAFAKSRVAAGQNGSIINIASLLSFQGGIRVPSYTASKSGVAGLTKILSNEWAAQGITVNSVAPGYVVSNNTTDLRNDPERNKAILDRIPMGRWADPEDIAGAVTFLAGPAARYVTGVTLPVDGGWLGR